MEGCTYFCNYQRSAPGRECPSGPASPGPCRDWFAGLRGLKFCWPGVGRVPGRRRYNARDLENPGYLGCLAYLNYIGGNMQYLPIYFTKAIYPRKRIENRHCCKKIDQYFQPLLGFIESACLMHFLGQHTWLSASRSL